MVKTQLMGKRKLSADAEHKQGCVIPNLNIANVIFNEWKNTLIKRIHSISPKLLTFPIKMVIASHIENT